MENGPMITVTITTFKNWDLFMLYVKSQKIIKIYILTHILTIFRCNSISRTDPCEVHVINNQNLKVFVDFLI